MDRKIQNKISRYGLNLLDKDIDFLKLGDNRFFGDSKVQRKRLKGALDTIKENRENGKSQDWLTLTLEKRLLKRLYKSVEIQSHKRNSTVWKIGGWNYEKRVFQTKPSGRNRWGETYHSHEVTIPKKDAVNLLSMQWGFVDGLEGFRKEGKIIYIYNKKKGLIKAFGL